jgi:restriction system protein
MNVLAVLFAAYWWFIPIFLAVLYLKSPAGKGFVGELLVNVSAMLMLDRAVYRLIRNVTLPTEDGTTQIDHIIVSEYGVFVIETKNYAGWIFGGPQQKMWTQKFPRSSRQFQNPLHQNYKHVRTLAALLELDGSEIHSLIVFVGNSTFKTAMPENVTTSGGYVRFIKSKNSSVLSAEQVAGIVDKIESGRLKPSLKTNRDHTRHVKEILEKKTVAVSPVVATTATGSRGEGDVCPKCGAVLVLRTIKTGAKAGSAFIGCGAFPSCRFMQKVIPPAPLL